MTATLLGASLFALIGVGAFAPLEAWFGSGTAAATRWRAGLLCFGLFAFNSVAMRTVGDPLLDELDARGVDLDLPAWARVALALLLADVVGYWHHRAMHRIPLLWRLHRIHHTARELNFWEAWRQHPLDFLAHGLAVGVPAALLGISLSDIVGLVLALKAFTLYLHADLPWRHGPFADVIASPAWHRVHHSHDPRDHDRNFAGTFPWLDRLFGTHRAA
jgi:sterol desaturase/sphingolipid hydroxylase (fatty acid hydroxylase superfamily)